MTDRSATRTDIQTHWLFVPHILLFITAIGLLAVLNFSGNAVEIRRPVILPAGSVIALFTFGKNSSFTLITKIILLYTIEMLFNQLSGRFVYIGSFSVHLPLIALVPLTVSFICFKVGQSQLTSVDTNDLLKSWGIVFVVIILHMLFLFILLIIIGIQFIVLGLLAEILVRTYHESGNKRIYFTREIIDHEINTDKNTD